MQCPPVPAAESNRRGFLPGVRRESWQPSSLGITGGELDAIVEFLSAHLTLAHRIAKED